MKKKPHTIGTLSDDLMALGVEEEMTLIVHSSLKAIGEVDGGVSAVILALEKAVGPQGTIAMPTHTGGLSDPSGWRSPPAPPETWDVIRKEMLPFQSDLTPTRYMGFIPETFRKQNGVVRSSHPQVSWAAWGRHRNAIIENHGLEFGSGENSPLARLYDLDAQVLLIGVNLSKNTSLHLAEHRASFNSKTVESQSAPVLVNEQREWVHFDDLKLSDDDFIEIGNAFMKSGATKHGRVGAADSLLVSQRAIVDFAVEWMNKYRS